MQQAKTHSALYRKRITGILKGFTTNTLDRLDENRIARPLVARISKHLPEDWSNHFWDSSGFIEDCSIVIRTITGRI